MHISFKQRQHLHGEYGEQQEDNAPRPVFPGQHIDSCRKAKDDIQNTSRPNELLREDTRHPYIAVRQNDGNSETEYEEDEGVRIEAKVIAAAVDSTTIETLGGRITLDRDTRNDYKASEGQ